MELGPGGRGEANHILLYGSNERENQVGGIYILQGRD